METKYKFKELMIERYSTRNFQKKEVPENVLREIVSTAQRAPSWENRQPWNIYISWGKVLEAIRKDWIDKNNAKIKGYIKN